MADAQSAKGKAKSITELIAERHAKVQKDIEAGLIPAPKQKKTKKSQVSKGDDGAPEGLDGKGDGKGGEEGGEKVKKKRVRKTQTQTKGDPGSMVSNSLADPNSMNPNSVDPNSITPGLTEQ